MTPAEEYAARRRELMRHIRTIREALRELEQQLEQASDKYRRAARR